MVSLVSNPLPLLFQEILVPRSVEMVEDLGQMAFGTIKTQTNVTMATRDQVMDAPKNV